MSDFKSLKIQVGRYLVAIGCGLGMCLLCNACEDNLNANYPQRVKDNGDDYKNLRLVWSEEFDGPDGLLDEKVWNMSDMGGVIHDELQDYRKNDPRCTRVENGVLILEAFKDPHDGIKGWGSDEPYHFEYSSGEVFTQNKRAFRYGRIDVSAKLPTVQGAWPAIWLMPQTGPFEYYGEIDIMEYVWGLNSNHNAVHATCHTQAAADNAEGFSPTGAGLAVSNTLGSKFHLYSLIWTSDKIEILLDNVTYYTYEKSANSTDYDWPFDRHFYLILNLAVGGAWGGMWGVDESAFPARMEVDYVRYYEFVDDDTDDDGNKDDEGEGVLPHCGFNSIESGFEPSFDIYYDKKEVLNHLNCWYARSKAKSFGIDLDNGANGTKGSLKHEITKMSDPWSTDLTYPFNGYASGRYTLSFWAKSNKDKSPFCLSVTLCETEEDIDVIFKKQKTIVFQNGQQQIMTGESDVPCTMKGEMNKEWQQYSVTFDLPKNKLVKFVIKPNTNVNGVQWYNINGVDTENVVTWFDEFTFVPAEDKPEDSNLITNAGFEDEFETDKEPALMDDITQDIIRSNQGRWFAKKYNNNSLAIDANVAKTGGKSLKLHLESQRLNGMGDVELTHIIEGQEAGKYTFGFWAKSNKEDSPFAVNIMLYTSEDDFTKNVKDVDAVWVKSDVAQEIKKRDNGGWPYSAIYKQSIGKEWKKYEVTIDIPETQLIRFLIRPSTESQSGNSWPKSVEVTDANYWFDDFSFRAAE